jgi:hypothetical protein
MIAAAIYACPVWVALQEGGVLLSGFSENSSTANNRSFSSGHQNQKGNL